MNKTAIKNFAIWARNKLIADISYRAGLMGITAEGIHAALPQSTGQTEFYDIGTAEPYAITGTAIRQRRHLAELIQRKEKDTDYKTAYKYIIEEVAYTWFNRLIAVRFMEVNDYLPSHIRVLSSESGKMEPDLVTMPFDADLEFTNAEQQTLLELKNANKLDDVFRLLFIKQCNALNEILPALFEKTNDYTELLLNLSIIDQDGVVYHLVHDIPEEDFDVERGGQVEIIGWLYQFYNTEPKNEAFAKKGKITKEEVPAVTQLFTPDWIVRYMVENSLGRLWVEGHPNEDIKVGWKYYLEEAKQEPEVQAQLTEIRAEYAKLNPEDIKIIDPCMGSGHILVYAFDVLMKIYESAGYGQRDATRLILENNLYGLDIDDRAFQMAYFAVMMKARQYNRRIINGEINPKLYSIQESNGINRSQMNYFGKGMTENEKKIAVSQLTYLLDVFKDAKEYGSILTVNHCDWDLLYRFISSIESIGQLSFDVVGVEETGEKLLRIIDQGHCLAQQFEITITNPPYMAGTNASMKLNTFMKKNYPSSKGDLFAIFIERCKMFQKKYGYLAMITMQSWMFLSSFERLREVIFQSEIVNLLKIGFNSFPDLNSQVAHACAFVICNNGNDKYTSRYFDLNTGKVTDDKERVFLARKENNHFFERKNGEFKDIPGKPVAFSFSESFLKVFSQKKMSDYAEVITGMTTGNNTEFLRLWPEINMNKAAIGAVKMADVDLTKQYWFPYSKGGERRNWYGNTDYLVNWSRKNEFNRSKTTLQHLYLLPALTWPFINTDTFSARYLPAGYLWDVAGSPCFISDETMRKYCLGFMCSKVAATMLSVINPTINVQAVDIEKLPVIKDNNIFARVVELVDENLNISTKEWNSYEMSWGFSKHPLIGGTSIKEKYEEWESSCENWFSTIKKNEETLNRLFITAYNISDDLDPYVEDKRVTVRKASLQREIKSLLSYAIGCMFGRYSLDKDGIAFAGGQWDSTIYYSFMPDRDNIIPITDEEYLEDDVVSRLCAWLKVVYGDRCLEENLDFIAEALGTKGNSSRDRIRNYFLNEFFGDHCQTYSVTGSGKRPIYWLFDSGKQNGIKALIYLHRYNADTIGNLRIDYLHRMQRVYESEIGRMQDMIDHSTNAREIGQATKRRDKLTKQLKECREYDEKLAHLALSRIELDLDDGVKVNYRRIQTANDGKLYEVLADSKNIMAKK